MSFTETMLPAKIELKYENRDWSKVWLRLMSGVLSPPAKNCLFLIIHERVATRERGHRLMNNLYDSPLCNRCLVGHENIAHRYITCGWVSDAWNALKEILESLDQLLIFESDHDLINLNFASLQNEDPVLWLIGEYVFFIDQEVVWNSRRAMSHNLFGYLESRRQDCMFMQIPAIGHILRLHLESLLYD